MADHSFETDPVMRPSWKWLLAFGVLLILGGVIALLNPLAASLTATAIAAAAFFVAGVLQIWMGFSGLDGSGSRAGSVILGVLFLLFAVAVMFDPLGGVISLTILLGFFFLMLGLVRLWIGYRLRPRPASGWMMAAGAVSALLGLLILIAVPTGALGILGIFLGVELLSSGFTAVAAALIARRV